MKRRLVVACITFSVHLHAADDLRKVLPEGTQTIISQLENIPLPKNSRLQQSSDDLSKPLMSELATKLNTVRTQLKGQVRLQKKDKHSAFVLKALLSELYKNPLLDQKNWHTLSSKEKHSFFFEPAWNSVLELNQEAIKDALRVIYFSNPQMLAFINELKSFTQQEYLKGLEKNTLKKSLFSELFLKTNALITLKPEIIMQLKRGNLTLPSIAVLDDIANRFFILEKHAISTPKGLWNDVELWLPRKGSTNALMLDTATVNEMILQMYTIFQLRDWFNSPGTAADRFSRWYFLPSMLNKPFPGMNGIYTAVNLNSAEVIDKGTVYYRNEELIKNVVHEMFHAIQTEYGISPDTSSDFIQKHLALSRTDGGKFLLSEAIVETLTFLASTMLYASQHSKDKAAYLSNVQNLWKWQKAFAYYKAAQLLFINNFSSFAEFVQPQKTKFRVRETTAAAEYLIFKAALIYNPERFLAVLKLPATKRQKDLQNLLLETMNNPNFQKEINFYLGWIKQHPQSSKLFNSGKLVLF